MYRRIQLVFFCRVFYWTDWGTNARIESANYDGTGRRAIITTNIKWPNALAVDFQSMCINRRLYKEM